METTHTTSSTDIPIPQALRPMVRHDIPQVSRIDLAAFPTLWPPPPFERDLQNRPVRYLVAYSPNVSYTDGNNTSDEDNGDAPQPASQGFIPRMRRILGLSQPTPPQAPTELITGFVGTWFITDEAHLTAIAVSEACRGRGIGELLLMATLELALIRRCRMITLEVRVSNTAAQRLYQKYGFRRTDLRKHYYSDNREDALVMTTDPLNTADSRRRLWDLGQAYTARYGEPSRILA